MADFPKVGDGFPQSRWLIFPKLVTDLPKIGGGFPKIGGRFSLNQLNIFPTTEPIMLDNFTVGDGSLSKEKWVKEFLSVLKNFARLHVLICLP